MNAWLATSCRLASSVLAMYGWLQWKRDCPPLAWLAVTYSKGLLHCSVAGIAIKESLQWKRGFSRLAVKGWLQWNRGWPRLCNEKMGPAKSVLRIHWFGASVENAASIPCGFTLLSSSSTVNSSAPWAAPAPPNAGSHSWRPWPRTPRRRAAPYPEDEGLSWPNYERNTPMFRA